MRAKIRREASALIAADLDLRVYFGYFHLFNTYKFFLCSIRAGWAPYSVILHTVYKAPGAKNEKLTSKTKQNKKKRNSLVLWVYSSLCICKNICTLKNNSILSPSQIWKYTPALYSFQFIASMFVYCKHVQTGLQHQYWHFTHSLWKSHVSSITPVTKSKSWVYL